MAWRGVRNQGTWAALASAFWLVACGGSTTDDVIGSGNPPGSSGSGGTSSGGTSSGGTSSGGTSSGGTSSGGTSSGGTASGGTSSGGSAGVAGGGADCPAAPPQGGVACPVDGASCAYQIDACINVFCTCNGGTWGCFGDGNPQCQCSEPAVAGAACSQQGQSCGDACGNGCICNSGKWFCDGPCNPGECAPGAKCNQGDGCGSVSPQGCQVVCECGPSGTFQCKEICENQCAPGAQCQPGTGCGGVTPDGCDINCKCSPNGTYQCKTTCGGGCFQGASCQPGSACGTGGPGGCETNCYCGDSGTLQCKTTCASCPPKPPKCGTGCAGAEGSSCTCFSGNAALPCTCTGSSAGSQWQCSDVPPIECAPGAKCNGTPCTTSTADGCKLYCECNFNGTYDCKQDCPNNTCAPGASCAPGTGCSVPQGDPGCTLSCTCSPAGLFQCSASCSSDGCPATMPPPGSPCDPAGAQECKFDDGSFCFCNQGAWICASP